MEHLVVDEVGEVLPLSCDEGHVFEMPVERLQLDHVRNPSFCLGSVER